jgi:hypothetical protein
MKPVFLLLLQFPLQRGGGGDFLGPCIYDIYSESVLKEELKYNISDLGTVMFKREAIKLKGSSREVRADFNVEQTGRQNSLSLSLSSL